MTATTNDSCHNCDAKVGLSFNWNANLTGYETRNRVLEGDLDDWQEFRTLDDGTIVLYQKLIIN